MVSGPRAAFPKRSLAALSLTLLGLAACASGAQATSDGDTDNGNSGSTNGGSAGTSGYTWNPLGGRPGGSAVGTGGDGRPGSAGDTSGGGNAVTGGCGDGVKSASEQCDEMDFGGATCASVLSHPNIGGILRCSPTCVIETTGCKANPTCGDGVIDQATESCDGGDFGPATCASVTGNSAATGDLTCMTSCAISTASCTVGAYCGDGKRDPNEACDGIDFGMSTCATTTGNAQEAGILKCTAMCTVDSSHCALNPVCGDGSKNTATEQCDGTDLDGATCQSLLGSSHATGTVACTKTCTFDNSGCSVPAYCGDATKNGSEQCDGSDFGGASCATLLGAGHSGSLVCAPDCTVATTGCTTVAACGDGTKNQASEQCDGADLAGATCASLAGPGSDGSITCFPNCTYDTSGCSKAATCGNGAIDSGEQCDGANLGGETCAMVLMDTHAAGDLTCNSSCTLDSSGCSIAPYCGDGNLDSGEECDDGNTTDGDGCSPNCTVECFSGEVEYQTHCYAEMGDSVSWNQASTSCQSYGGHLVTIGDMDENEFVWNSMGSGSTAARWIGMNDLASTGDFAWITGEAASYFNWASSEPVTGGSQHCVEFYYTADDWSDVTCTQSRWYWCEYEPIVKNP